jgi:hypothetical protein
MGVCGLFSSWASPSGVIFFVSQIMLFVNSQTMWEGKNSPYIQEFGPIHSPKSKFRLFKCNNEKDKEINFLQSEQRTSCKLISLKSKNYCVLHFCIWTQQKVSLSISFLPPSFSRVEPKSSGPSWLAELRYGRNHPGLIPRWSELWGWFLKNPLAGETGRRFLFLNKNRGAVLPHELS